MLPTLSIVRLSFSNLPIHRRRLVVIVIRVIIPFLLHSGMRTSAENWAKHTDDFQQGFANAFGSGIEWEYQIRGDGRPIRSVSMTARQIFSWAVLNTTGHPY